MTERINNFVTRTRKAWWEPLTKLEAILEQKHITQAQLARDIDELKQTVNRVVKGKHKPNVVLAIKIADYLGVDVKDCWPM